MKDAELMRSVRRRESRIEQDAYWISSSQCVPAAASSEGSIQAPYGGYGCRPVVIQVFQAKETIGGS